MTLPNYIKPTPDNGLYYLWVHDAALAMLHIFGPRSRHTKGIFLHGRKPRERDKQGRLFRFHRIRIEVVRTARECAALDRRRVRAKRLSWERMQKLLGQGRAAK